MLEQRRSASELLPLLVDWSSMTRTRHLKSQSIITAGHWFTTGSISERVRIPTDKPKSPWISRHPSNVPCGEERRRGFHSTILLEEWSRIRLNLLLFHLQWIFVLLHRWKQCHPHRRRSLWWMFQNASYIQFDERRPSPLAQSISSFFLEHPNPNEKWPAGDQREKGSDGEQTERGSVGNQKGRVWGGGR